MQSTKDMTQIYLRNAQKKKNLQYFLGAHQYEGCDELFMLKVFCPFNKKLR